MILNLIYALLLTLIIEIPICFFCFKNKNYKSLLIIIVTNIITNIGMNLIYIYINNSLQFLIILEIIVFCLEGLIYYLLLHQNIKSYLISFVANLISLVVGLTINNFVLQNNIKIFIISFLICFIIELILIIVFINMFNKNKHNK